MAQWVRFRLPTPFILRDVWKYIVLGHKIHVGGGLELAARRSRRVRRWADVSARGACDSSSPGKSICCRQQCRKEEGGRMKHHKEGFVVVPIPIVSGGSGRGGF